MPVPGSQGACSVIASILEPSRPRRGISARASARSTSAASSAQPQPISRGKNSVPTAPTSGTKSIALNTGKFDIILYPDRCHSWVDDEIHQNERGADEDRQRIVARVAGLQTAQPLAHATDDLPNSARASPKESLFKPDAPEHADVRHRHDKDRVIKLVNVILVLQERHQRIARWGESRLAARIERPGNRDADGASHQADGKSRQEQPTARWDAHVHGIR